MQRLDEHKLSELVRLREERGFSIRRIAAHLGVSEGAVGHQLLQLGVERRGKPPAKIWATRTERRIRMRYGKPVIYFTQAEDLQVLAWDAEGVPAAEIARRLDPPRHPRSVRARLAILARRDERLASGSQLAEAA